MKNINELSFLQEQVSELAEENKRLKNLIAGMHCPDCGREFRHTWNVVEGTVYCESCVDLKI